MLPGVQKFFIIKFNFPHHNPKAASKILIITSNHLLLMCCWKFLRLPKRVNWHASTTPHYLRSLNFADVIKSSWKVEWTLFGKLRKVFLENWILKQAVRVCSRYLLSHNLNAFAFKSFSKVLTELTPNVSVKSIGWSEFPWTALTVS